MVLYNVVSSMSEQEMSELPDQILINWLLNMKSHKNWLVELHSPLTVYTVQPNQFPSYEWNRFTSD